MTAHGDHTHHLAGWHRPSMPVSTVPPGLPRLSSAKAPLEPGPERNLITRQKQERILHPNGPDQGAGSREQS